MFIECDASSMVTAWSNAVWVSHINVGLILLYLHWCLWAPMGDPAPCRPRFVVMMLVSAQLESLDPTVLQAPGIAFFFANDKVVSIHDYIDVTYAASTRPQFRLNHLKPLWLTRPIAQA